MSSKYRNIDVRRGTPAGTVHIRGLSERIAAGRLSGTPALTGFCETPRGGYAPLLDGIVVPDDAVARQVLAEAQVVIDAERAALPHLRAAVGDAMEVDAAQLDTEAMVRLTRVKPASPHVYWRYEGRPSRLAGVWDAPLDAVPDDIVAKAFDGSDQFVARLAAWARLEGLPLPWVGASPLLTDEQMQRWLAGGEGRAFPLPRLRGSLYADEQARALGWVIVKLVVPFPWKVGEAAKRLGIPIMDAGRHRYAVPTQADADRLIVELG